MSDLVVFDTSVLVDQFRSGKHTQRISSVSGLIRNCSVVLAELMRGAMTQREHRLVETIRNNHPTLTPTEKNWIESGEILARIRSAAGLTPGKLRELHFDVLIALTVRSVGARLITINGADFFLIRRYRNFELEVW